MPDLWDELTKKIIDDDDKVLFGEATIAARGGALRMAFIAVWLSCAESFKRKFKDAANTDNAAAKAMGSIEDKEAGKRAIDALVLGEAKKYGFITDAEFMQLKNIYDQRCIYSHPYEQAPLPEQLDAAAAIVVEFVLGRPVKLRHGYLARQVDLLCTNATYLDDHFPAVKRYAVLVHERSSPDLYLWFLRKLWKEVALWANDPAMAVFVRRVVWFTVAFLQTNDTSFFDSWNTVNDLTEYGILSQSLVMPHLYTRISQRAQDIVVGNHLAWAKTQALSAKMVQNLHDAGALSPRQIERLTTALPSIPAHVLAPVGIHPRYYYDETIEKLSSRNWFTQEIGIRVLEILGPDGVAKLDAPKQVITGNNVLQATEGDCNTARSFISEISSGRTLWPESFIEGILAECVVNDRNQYRFKARYAREAMLCIRSVELTNRAGVVQRVVTRLLASTPKYRLYDEDDRVSVVAAMDAAMATDAGGCDFLQPLREAVAELKLPQQAI